MPYQLYARLIPVVLQEGESASQQLKAKFGLDPSEISFIVISHFHADHISGCTDFPNAKFVYSREGWAYLRERKYASCCSDVKCCLNGFIPNLLPKDFEERSVVIGAERFVDSASVGLSGLSGFKVCDLFGDGSIYIVDLPGHCKGHFGCYFSQGGKGWFLVGDAAWSTEAIQHNHLPHIITKFVAHYDWNDYTKTLAALNKLYNDQQQQQEQQPIEIIPSHCWQVYEKYITRVSKL